MHQSSWYMLSDDMIEQVIEELLALARSDSNEPTLTAITMSQVNAHLRLIVLGRSSYWTNIFLSDRGNPLPAMVALERSGRADLTVRIAGSNDWRWPRHRHTEAAVRMVLTQLGRIKDLSIEWLPYNLVPAWTAFVESGDPTDLTVDRDLRGGLIRRKMRALWIQDIPIGHGLAELLGPETTQLSLHHEKYYEGVVAILPHMLAVAPNLQTLCLQSRPCLCHCYSKELMPIALNRRDGVAGPLAEILLGSDMLRVGSISRILDCIERYMPGSIDSAQLVELCGIGTMASLLAESLPHVSLPAFTEPVAVELTGDDHCLVIYGTTGRTRKFTVTPDILTRRQYLEVRIIWLNALQHAGSISFLQYNNTLEAYFDLWRPGRGSFGDAGLPLLQHLTVHIEQYRLVDSHTFKLVKLKIPAPMLQRVTIRPVLNQRGSGPLRTWKGIAHIGDVAQRKIGGRIAWILSQFLTLSKINYDFTEDVLLEDAATCSHHTAAALIRMSV